MSAASLFAIASCASALVASAPAVAAPSPGFYLSLGASESVGVQPSARYPHGGFTNEGYANDLVSALASEGVNLTLTHLGCPGESTTSAISGFDRCSHASGSQLSDAVAFLKAHTNDAGLVTIDLGFNDLRPCVLQEFVNPSCASAQLAFTRENLATIVSTLRAAAGPKVTFIGLNHADPFLAYAVNRTRDLNFAAASASAITALNATLANVYSSAHIPVANVAGAFASAQATPTRLAHIGWAPLNVTRECNWTWMCPSGNVGPNIHPNDKGYQVMARAIEQALPQSFFATQNTPSN
jgi:lysophospholipase L1-like esterase